MDSNKALFETTPVPKALASLAVPTILSQLIVMIYNMADTFFLGRTNNPYMVAATSMAYVLFFLLNALASLFGIGGGSLISRLLGQGRKEDAKGVSAFSFYGTLLVTALYCLLCYVFLEPILLLMGASENTLGFAADYTLWVVVIGGIPATLSMTMSYLLRSEGHSGKASFGLSMGGVLNIFLDPLFMFVLLPPGQEVVGAAVATVLSNVAALAYYIVIYCRLRKASVLSLSGKRLAAGAKYTGEILSVGLPSALNTLLVCVVIMVTNGLTARHGDIPLAAVGIMKKLEMLPNNVGTGLCQGMIPLISYNFASGNHDRMKETIRTARTWGLLFTAACLVLFLAFAGGISRLFIQEPETVALTTDFLRIMCLASPLTILNFHICYTLQAMGKGTESLALSVCRQGLFCLPLLFLMDLAFGLYGIVWTQFIANGLTAILSLILYRRVLRQLEKYRQPQEDQPQTVLKPSRPGVILTIAREHGSAGKQIGKLVAERLDIPFYYKETTALAAQESGLHREFLSDINDNIPALLKELYLSSAEVQQAVLAQSKIIRRIADNGSCVIVGRAADYVLRDYENVVRVFIYAPEDYKVRRVMEVYGDTPEEARRNVRRSDEARSSYYQTISGSNWRDPHNYDFSLDSSIGVEKSVEAILALLNSR